VLDQHHAVRWDQLPFPSPNEVKITFVLANKEKWLIPLNLCQNILCYIDQRNTHSTQTCSTSKKECFCWHRATFYLLALLPGFFLLSNEIHAKLFYCLLTRCLYPACPQHAQNCISMHSLQIRIINQPCKHSITHHF